MTPAEALRLARLYRQKSAFIDGNRKLLTRARLHWEFMRRRSHVSFPVYGPILESIRDGRFELGEHVTVFPGCWITVPGDATLKIGDGTFLNLGVMVAAYDRVEIGKHCMFANHCFITDADHNFTDPTMAVFNQGYNVKGKTTIGDNVWCGVNVAVMAGVSIGERCVIGANSVVTTDIPPFSIAAGAPARVIRAIDFDQTEQ